MPRAAFAALAAAALFGASTPLAKALAGDSPPVLLAALLYLGSGIGLSVARLLRRGRAAEARLSRGDLPWLAGAVAVGGVLAPILLMFGLLRSPASTVSLLLNLEAVFTALMAWLVFRENVAPRIVLGFAAIVAGGVVLSWPQDSAFGIPLASLAVAAASLCWAVDNNLTQRISGRDPMQVAAVKGTVAGGVNLGLAIASGSALPSGTRLLGLLAVGFVGYGVSLVLFVTGLRHLGTARTSAYFSTAPFLGAVLSVVLLREPVGASLLGAAALMAVGVWLHLSEVHEHEHRHEQLAHSHRHVHDEHHQHSHSPELDDREPHTHRHQHEPLTHTHPHYPDLHHRHRH